jgi:integrase
MTTDALPKMAKSAKGSSKKAKSRIYWREQGGERRAYADFRDAGGKREALIQLGDKRATTDRVIAEKLVADRLAELLGDKRDAAYGRKAPVPIAEFVAHHLIQKARSGKYAASWLANAERMLGLAVDHFGATGDLGTIEVADVQEWAAVIAARPNGRGGTLSGGAVRHHLNVLSNLYVRAQAEGKLKVGTNPVALMPDKPEDTTPEAHWLEIHEGALLLEAARTYKPQRVKRAMPFLYPLVATYLLTGGRETEVLGLEIGDVNFERGTVTFRPNQWRRLKTKKSHRTVPLWPQLAAILKDYLKSSARAGGLLFPSVRLKRDEPEGMVTDFRKALDAVAERAGWKEGEIRSKMLRHTYCTARLQTLDNGAPVSTWVVAKEMGHTSSALIDEVYGHLGEVRHRSDVMEYRVEQHEKKLSDKLKLLRSA